MNVEIVHDRINALLDRREVRFRIVHEGGGTPPRSSVRREVAKIIGVSERDVFIPYIRGRRGKPVSEGLALIFMNGVKLSQIEPKYRRKLESGEEKSKEKG